jgi:outer membrane receptor protein involved in Fe transport
MPSSPTQRTVMPRTCMTAAALILLTAATSPLAAQTPTGAAAPGNIISYPAQFFSALKPNTAYDMVLRLPGFAIDDGSSVRGFGGAAGNVLIDGQRPTSKSDDLVSILQRMPASQVVRIDVIRGATPGIDMQGKTTVANVILRKSGGFTGAVQYGQYTARQGYKDPDVHLDANWRKNGRSLAGSLLAFKGHLNSEGPGPHEIKGPNGELIDRSLTRNSEPTWEYKATASGETPIASGHFSAHLSFDAQPLKLTSIDLFRVAGLQEEHDRQTQNVGELGVNYTHDLFNNLGLEIIGLQQLSRTNFQSDFQTSAQDQQFRLDDRQSESIGRIVLHWQPSAKLTGEGGGEFAYNSLKAITDFSVNGTPVELPAANVRVTEKRGEGFGTLTWRPLDRLSVEAGLRVETSILSATGDVGSSRRLTFAKPRLILSWSPDDSDQVRLRVEREVGQLAFSQFVATASLNGTGIVAGNPNLLPQQDWAFEAALEHHFWRDGVVSLTFRRLALADVIDRAPVFARSGIFDAPGNIGNGTETDLIASFNFPLARLGLNGFIFRGDITWRKSEVTDPTTHDGRRISGQHPLDAGLHLTQDLPQWNLSWGVEFFSAALERFFRFNEIDTNRTAASAIAYVDYKPRPDIALRLQLFTTNRYEVDRAIFGGPRNLTKLQTLDIQKRTFGPVVFTRIRKTF